MKLVHPVIAGVSVEVHHTESKDWLKAGWLRESSDKAPDQTAEDHAE